MELLFASTNSNKVAEVRAILASRGIRVIGLEEAGDAAGRPEPVEDGETFADNARIKAVYYAKATGRWTLADDSGLEVDALGGGPGVRSARYGGIGGTRAERDAANNRKLLNALSAVPDEKRTARFVCAMCLADAEGRVAAETRGTVEGVIGREPRGHNGFGYDPLFGLPHLGCTSAELPTEQKNALSHRGDAARQMADRLDLFEQRMA
ncbi:MAG: RdgB/HAM1 family non-canonical purine NTP pyrophosphatase [Planctomycetota bacterium]|jgi:XTP/dITP diphosphohydrolase